MVPLRPHELGVNEPPEATSEGIVALVLDAYAEHLPLVPGAAEAVRARSGRWPLGLASSSNRPVIDAFLGRSRPRGCFSAVVSSEEVARGKPAPDVYLAAARLLNVDAHEVAAVEDSANGIRSAHAAGARVIAIPNREFPPPADVLGLASRVLGSVAELTSDVAEGLSRT